MWKRILFIIALCTCILPGFAAQLKNAAPKKADSPAFVLYYFYSQPRCKTCLAIETETGIAVHKNFANELKSGVLQWIVLDLDKPENKHFIKDFQLYTKSVVLVEKKGTKIVRHKLLQKVWELIHQPTAFEAYVVKSLQGFMLEDDNG